ncbi:unnamed protein product [Blepharisma stoltei]|uniref:EF-hand domain-containing protein n=1 Tax=Blepharisma stoltei TaxID=1481888 RepID=A0AAU9JYW7_9CILI|nr:unnamed protein product [Blepharisma stoltei]
MMDVKYKIEIKGIDEDENIISTEKIRGESPSVVDIEAEEQEEKSQKSEKSQDSKSQKSEKSEGSKSQKSEKSQKSNKLSSHASKPPDIELNNSQDLGEAAQGPENPEQPSNLEENSKQDEPKPQRKIYNACNLNNSNIYEEDKSRLEEAIKAIESTKDTVMEVLNLFREEDSKLYNKLISKGVKGKHLKFLLSELYLRVNSFPESALIFLLNSYDEAGLARLFLSFYLEFDASNDRKMQEDELEQCIEFLGLKDYIGKEKMIAALKIIGIDASNKLSFLQEGSAAQKILNDETRSHLFQILKVKKEKPAEDAPQSIMNIGKALLFLGNNTSDDYVDFPKFLPYLIACFLEVEIKSFFKKQNMFRIHLGFPYKVLDNGKVKFDPNGQVGGLYRTFISYLRGEADINKEVLTYRIVSKALIAYRSEGYCESITLEGLERILKKVRNMMDVDLISGLEKKKFTMKQILPFLAAQFATESTWNTVQVKNTIEKYDHLVHWEGGGNICKIKKSKIHKLLAKEISPDSKVPIDVLTLALNKVLKKLIPTLNSSASYHIVKQLSKIDGIYDKPSKLFSMKNIFEDEDIYARLHDYTMNTKLDVFLVNVQHKDELNLYKLSRNLDKAEEKFQLICDGKYRFGAELINAILDKGLNKVEEDSEKQKDVQRRFMVEKALRFLFDRPDDYKSQKTEEKEVTKDLEKNKKISKIHEEDSSKNKAKELQNANERQMKLQAQSNKIDRLISEVENIKLARALNTRESSAFPNSKEVNPLVLLNMIDGANSDSKDLKKLKEYLKENEDQLTYQDVAKFLTIERLKKTKSKNAQKHNLIINSQSRYLINQNNIDEYYDNYEDLSETEEITSEITTKEESKTEEDEESDSKDESVVEEKKEKKVRNIRDNDFKIKYVMGSLYDEEKVKNMKLKPSPKDAEFKLKPTPLFEKLREQNRSVFSSDPGQPKKESKIEKSRGCECILF